MILVPQDETSGGTVVPCYLSTWDLTSSLPGEALMRSIRSMSVRPTLTPFETERVQANLECRHRPTAPD